MSNSSQVSNKNGKVFDYEVVKMTVSNFASRKSFQDQMNSSGVSLVNEKRVDQIEKNIWAALNAPHNIPLLNKRGEVLQGNHRLVALKRNQLMPNRVGPELEFMVAQLTVDTTSAEDSEIAIRGNLDTNTSNYRTHLISSSTDISVKVMKPVEQAIRKVWPDAPTSIVNQLVPRLGTVLNRNSMLASKLPEKVNVSGYDFTAARRYPEATSNFFDAEAYVDLRKYVDQIADAIQAGLLTMKDLFEDGTWAEKFGKKKTNLTYILVAMSMRGEIVLKGRAKGCITPGKIKTAVKDYAARIVNAVRKFNNSAKAKGAEDTIMLIFQEQADSVTITAA